MKVIDLLNKIAKGEKVPANIKWQGVIFQYEENNYRAGGIYLIEWVNKTLSNLNDEIEIIEEPKEELEEIELLDTPYTKNENDFEVEHKINELIANQNKIIREFNLFKKSDYINSEKTPRDYYYFTNGYEEAKKEQ